MRTDDPRSFEATRHGAYLCVSVPPQARSIAGAVVAELTEQFALRNEFEPGDEPPAETIAFLRRVRSTAGEIADAQLLHGEVVIHLASATPGPVTRFCTELARRVPSLETRALGGVVRSSRYTGNEMHNFAYAHRVVQHSGRVMPNAFLLPISKTTAWWEKDWMERHTYFLPRFDDSGRRVSEGHALAAAGGIASLMRRTYTSPTEPAPAGAYDFLTYFECADQDVPTFHEVCASLRDVARNPEWKYVREGPTWHGRRVATWAELFGPGTA